MRRTLTGGRDSIWLLQPPAMIIAATASHRLPRSTATTLGIRCNGRVPGGVLTSAISVHSFRRDHAPAPRQSPYVRLDIERSAGDSVSVGRLEDFDGGACCQFAR